ncbi:MAG: hypothetical protein CMI79_06455 [Candidatus Pelagibacter sp.]|nr:hypothetical protein [Candidatus Pelagibacter sp.]|tara:strand:- start:19951 stop:20529 length:579 start_codon:yes stop_codon:yes gene_type:complete
MALKKKIFFLINKLNEINLDYVKLTGAILVLRNTEEISIEELKKYKNELNRRRIVFFIANNLRALFVMRSNNFYVSAYNKKNFCHLKKINKKINIIGSAHNYFEINQKIKQGCNQIILSRLFKTNYVNKKSFLGKNRFNLLANSFSVNFIALGGINEKNFNQTRDLNITGIALQAAKKKAGKFIPAFFKKTF